MSTTQSAPKRTLHLRVLNEVSMSLQSLLESENFYQEIVNIIQTKLHYYTIQFWSVTSKKTVRLEAQAGAYRKHLPIGFELGTGTDGIVFGITGQVIKTKSSYLCNDVSTDPHFSDLSLPVQSKAELCIPILKDNEVLGTLNAEGDVINYFSEDDIVTLEGIASQVAVAVSNKNIYSEVKDFNDRLRRAVDEKTQELRFAHERILDQQRLLQKENKALKRLIDQDNQALEIVGTSTTISSLISMVDKIAPTMATVLIQGESGTGKELVARRLHFKSDRREGPYVVVNCGALQETLLESELFGHERGSFTGAVAQKQGLVETADRGTLFLDEIGELPLPMQTKILRFLQEGEFYRIGGKKSIRVDVRVISATNRDLESEVKGNRFREDLFYRLNTISLRVPPLRKRKEDIPLLVDFFLKHSRFGGASQQIKKVDNRVYEVFRNYDWPGNIRELQNTIERLKILAENHEIRVEDIPFNIRVPRSIGYDQRESRESRVNAPLEEIEKEHILKTLAFNHGNKTKTAQNLGITIKTLYNKLHRYGVLDQPNEAMN